ncbi:unnamed protein product, partial [Meganyctiphanes norvegica]
YGSLFKTNNTSPEFVMATSQGSDTLIWFWADDNVHVFHVFSTRARQGKPYKYYNNEKLVYNISTTRQWMNLTSVFHKNKRILQFPTGEEVDLRQDNYYKFKHETGNVFWREDRQQLVEPTEYYGFCSTMIKEPVSPGSPPYPYLLVAVAVASPILSLVAGLYLGSVVYTTKKKTIKLNQELENLNLARQLDTDNGAHTGHSNSNGTYLEPIQGHNINMSNRNNSVHVYEAVD